MLVNDKGDSESANDVMCDACLLSTKTSKGVSQYGTMQANWSAGAKHEGERYELRLCEKCFFVALLALRQQRRVEHLFSEDAALMNSDESFGRVRPED
ncbi:hypothetical protein GCM10009304_30170 [Pseudomonas matsuisoli]|uniref:Uncharacterized protein n=1 Tax=Pseudomonas matsuisoli TaxID=1515666 RepID=A0A917UZX4_9PSED|nr:hypothetical protein GCM10009304_30170 [Pseudomonas matsuisoli]